MIASEDIPECPWIPTLLKIGWNWRLHTLLQYCFVPLVKPISQYLRLTLVLSDRLFWFYMTLLIQFMRDWGIRSSYHVLMSKSCGGCRFHSPTIAGVWESPWEPRYGGSFPPTSIFRGLSCFYDLSIDWLASKVVINVAIFNPLSLSTLSAHTSIFLES